MTREYTIGDSLILLCKCEREKCGHVWIAKDMFVPSRCARCKSPNWGNGGRGESAGSEQKKAATQRDTSAGFDAPPLDKERPPEVEVKQAVEKVANIPGVKLGRDLYKPYVPEKYRKGQKSKFFHEAK